MTQPVCVCMSGSGLITQFVEAMEKSNRPLQTHKLFIRQEKGKVGLLLSFSLHVHVSEGGQQVHDAITELFQLRGNVS